MDCGLINENPIVYRKRDRPVRTDLSNTDDEFSVDVRVEPGSHDQETAVNKQLGDKERMAAGLENPNLVDLINSI
ncbi:unnamed protein product [Arabis nemorensis]|uniref:Uncharacterized protein n=1 Tax=Arabis nemorensis TaxID=586526 RepID=A0A565B7W5_9BRAS|nr:unnamed protein product [Arabis nemorensis]